MEKGIGASLEYLSMTKPKRFLKKTLCFFQSIPQRIWKAIQSIPRHIQNFFRAIGRYFYGLYEALRYGNYKVKLSSIIFGFGCLSYRQIWRGILLLLYEIVFILYMVFFGGQYISKLGTLGTVETTTTESGFKIVGDNSFNIMLYSVMTIVIILLTFVVWTMSIKLAYDSQKNDAIAKRLKSAKDDVNGFLNENFHYTLLSIPTILLVLFTVIPLIFMILVGFTNYNATHMPPNKLFTWVGFDNFNTLLSGRGLGGGDLANFSYAFWKILAWTFLWAIVATFSNFFLGMVLALMINKKGIKLKKFWRTALVAVIAVPQFISLLLMSKMLTNDGIINVVLETIFHLKSPAVEWLMHPTEAKIAIILVNLWIGIPYTVLSATGILMNIPSDLYEASRIDGANAFKMFTKITLPYTMFVMGPSLITSFTGNLNNFNIIFLLTGGTVGFGDSRLVSAKAGDTDLLITWLYKLTVNENYYDIGSVIGIILFVIIAFISLIVYSRIGSNKNEEDFQ